MLHFVQLRSPSIGDATASYLECNGTFECHVLEDVAREDPDPSTQQNEAKVHGQTAIPGLIYNVTLEKSPRFGDDTITLRPIGGGEVPGFTGVRVHAGNGPEDSEGCPLVGDAVITTAKGPRIVGGTSGPALKRLKAKIKLALDAGEEVHWEVRDA